MGTGWCGIGFVSCRLYNGIRSLLQVTKILNMRDANGRLSELFRSGVFVFGKGINPSEGGDHA